MTLTLYLIRHGETDWNVEGRYQGQADPPLNSNGVAQAHQLAAALRDAGLQHLYTSPLRRAAQTAEILAQALDIPIIPEPRLKEIHQGDWQTRLRSEIQALYPTLFRQWEARPWDVQPPGGESLAEVQARVYQALDELSARHPTGRIGLVTHRIPIGLIKIRYQNLEPDLIRTLHLPNAWWEAIPIPPQS